MATGANMEGRASTVTSIGRSPDERNLAICAWVQQTAARPWILDFQMFPCADAPEPLAVERRAILVDRLGRVAGMFRTFGSCPAREDGWQQSGSSAPGAR
jgi:hypothetical protein